MVDFLFIIIKPFSLSLMDEMLQAEICRSRHFSEGVDQFERKFQMEECLTHHPLLVSEN